MHDNLYEAAFFNAMITVAAPENGFIGLSVEFRAGINAGIAAVVKAFEEPAVGLAERVDLHQALLDCQCEVDARNDALDAAWGEIDRLRALVANLAEELA